MEAAEASRRARVTFTIDLLGRRVVMDADLAKEKDEEEARRKVGEAGGELF